MTITEMVIDERRAVGMKMSVIILRLGVCMCVMVMQFDCVRCRPGVY